MADEKKRIINETTDTALASSGDYVIVDSQTEGTRKFDLGAALAAEVTARDAAIAAEASARSAAVSAEATTRAEADTAINGEITQLKEDLDAEIIAASIKYNPFNVHYWRNGYINPITGANASGTQYNISLVADAFLFPSEGVTRLEAKNGYFFRVFAYQLDGTYVGCWSVNGWVKSWTRDSLKTFNLLQYPEYKFRVDLNREDEQTATTAEYTNLIIYYSRFGEDGLRSEFTQDNLADDTTKVSGYLNTSGVIVASVEQTTRETTTDYIPVTPNDVYTYSIYCDSSVSYWFRICFYTADKTYISRQDDSIIFTAKQWRNFTAKTLQLTTPSNAYYVRVAQRHGFCTITKGVTEWEYMPSPIDIRRHWNLRPKQDYLVRSINHRGYGRVAPENTAPAFELSADIGFWGVENDIRHTSDGVPVLLHDETINRTARNADGTELSSTINIANITYEQALTYDFGIWMGDQYAGTKIMRFDDFVKLCRKKSLHCYNEIKDGTAAQAKELVRTAIRNGMKKHTSWISFSTSYLTAVLEEQPDARVGLVVSEVTTSIINDLIALKNGANEVFVSYHISYPPSETIIDSLIDNNIELECYTPNFISVVEGVDSYVTGMTSDWCIAGDVLYTGRNDIILFE